MGINQTFEPNTKKKEEVPPHQIKKQGQNVSTIVSNHLGFHEIINMILSPLHPGFTPKADLASAPFVGTLAKGL